MSAMINLEIPHINVLSKMDLLPKMKASELERYERARCFSSFVEDRITGIVGGEGE